MIIYTLNRGKYLLTECKRSRDEMTYLYHWLILLNAGFAIEGKNRGYHVLLSNVQLEALCTMAVCYER